MGIEIILENFDVGDLDLADFETAKRIPGRVIFSLFQY